MSIKLSNLFSKSIDVGDDTNVESKVVQKEVFQGIRLTTLKNTTRIDMNIRMASGAPLTETSSGSIKMRSGITAYFVLQ